MSILTIISKTGGSYALIDSNNGGAITKLVLKGQDIIRHPLKDDDPKKGYPSAILFPFPNRIKDGKYEFEGKEYKLEINEPQNHNAIHGFVAFQTFQILKQGDSSVELMFQYTGEKEGYPFPFKIKIIYTIKDNELSFITEVENTGNGNLPCGFAWHPYFGFNGSSVSEMTLKRPKSIKIGLDERNIPNGEFEPERGGLLSLKNIFLDNLYMLDDKKGETSIELRYKKKKIIIYQDSGLGKLNYFILYTPPNRNCIAIEPQSSSTDCFNNKKGLIVIKPKEKKTFHIKVEVTI